MPPLPDLPGGEAGLRLVFPADPASVRATLARLTAAAPLDGVVPGVRETAELVLAEVLNNVVEHAYRGAGGAVDLSLHRVPGGLACLVVDSGAPMPEGRPPAARRSVPPSTPPADLPDGGFGWALIRTLTVDLRYSREDGRNRLHFVIPFAS